jgi:hypothetical protein
MSISMWCITTYFPQLHFSNIGVHVWLSNFSIVTLEVDFPNIITLHKCSRSCHLYTIRPITDWSRNTYKSFNIFCITTHFPQLHFSNIGVHVWLSNLSIVTLEVDFLNMYMDPWYHTLCRFWSNWTYITKRYWSKNYHFT